VNGVVISSYTAPMFGRFKLAMASIILDDGGIITPVTGDGGSDGTERCCADQNSPS
jgi:hypothetical protein